MRLPLREVLAWGILCSAAAAGPGWMHVTINGRVVENSHYLEASFLYQLQTILGTQAASPKVTGNIVRRQGKELYIDINRVPSTQAALLREIARRDPPIEDISLEEIGAYMGRHYYALTTPVSSLQALLRQQPYRNNPNWLAVPVDSATFRRRRVLHIHKDRIADALVAYFDNKLRVIYPYGTLIAAESFDKQGNFVEAEILRKRADTLWNFAVYDHTGALIPASIAFNDEGKPAPDQAGFRVPGDCANCHRIDRLDFSGDPESPVLAPVQGFFHRLPARVPQIHLGPEYYDHQAFLELTEAIGRLKDSVFGVYGSLLLSELVGRKRLGTLTPDDRARYLRLQPYYPELLSSLDRVDSVTNSIGMRLVRIPASVRQVMIGSLQSDPEHRPDEQRHPLRRRQPFFLSMYKLTNGEFRRFRPDHHVAPRKGIDLGGADQPVVNVTFDEAQAFVDWLNQLPQERAAGRTYRLPDEEEWEAAAQGGERRRFPWGDQWPPPEGGRTFPNPYFLYDLAGKAREWTSSFYERYPDAPQGEIPYGPNLRVVRGSSWSDVSAMALRCAYRLPMAPSERSPLVGFRVAADIPSLR